MAGALLDALCFLPLAPQGDTLLVATARADGGDGDGGDGDNDDSGDDGNDSGGGGGGGADDVFRRDEPQPQRRQARPAAPPAPERAQGEIVARDLSEAELAALAARGSSRSMPSTAPAATSVPMSRRCSRRSRVLPRPERR